MYNIIKNAIDAGGYKLADMQRKINKMWVGGLITEEEADRLLLMASGGANTNAERPEFVDIAKNLYDKIRKLEARVEALEAVSGDEEQKPEAYEQWEPWDGISDKYQKNAVVAHNGMLWISHFPGQNVWEPGAPGTESMWVEHIAG